MSIDHTGMKRGFHHLSAAWYGTEVLKNEPEILDRISIGFYGSGTTGEFGVKWIKLGGRVTPVLNCFNDAWDALFRFKDVLEKMAEVDGKDISALEFCELLKSCGIEDMTRREEK